MSTVIGIDLGTSNSVIATLEHGRPRALSVDGSPIVPSVVLYQEDGTIVTGRQARNLALQFPERAVSSVKRAMGRVETIEVGDRSVAPEDVSAEILRALKTAAEAELGQDVDQAVITVPAYFDDAQRKATLAAGERAGLTVLRLLNEPTAAALVYERPPQESTTPEIMLVYDLGGGTFDVSVLEVMGTIREVRSSTGNSALGGDDFDEKLVQRFTEFLRTRHQTDVNSEAVTMARLRRAAQEAKVQLSTQIEVEVREEFLSGADDKPLHLELSITRREFEASITEMLDSTIELSRRALDEANLTADETLNRICLVGGSTRIPLVRHLLAESFGVEIHEEVDPDLAVGLGAAMQAALLQGQSVQRVLVDVTAHTLGIRTLDDVDDVDGYGYGYREADAFSPIVHRNTALPVERTEEFHTAVHHQEQVEIEVLQGESARASHNDRVGSFKFPLRPVPQGSPVWVQFAYDLNGIVRVTASQPGGADMTVQLEVSGSSAKGSETTAELGTTSPPARGGSTIVRRAEALLEELSPGDRSVLTNALEAYATADSDEARSQAEDALLDLFLEHESR